MFNQLSAPFPPEAIHWRAQNVAERNGEGSALALAYIDARDVQDRLDEVCGPANWQDEYTETPKGRLICTLSIRVGDDWVRKSDGAGDTDVEGEKGAISDALKRAGVKWGIGRYLYGLGNTWAPCELMKDRDGNLIKNSKGKLQWKAWKPAAHDVFAAKLKEASRPTGLITDATRDWLQAQIEASGSTVQDFLRSFTPTSLKAITYEQIPDAQEWLRKQKKAA